jgi:hypothetical protein
LVADKYLIRFAPGKGFVQTPMPSPSGNATHGGSPRFGRDRLSTVRTGAGTAENATDGGGAGVDAGVAGVGVDFGVV